jgi:hypothetical protein
MLTTYEQTLTFADCHIPYMNRLYESPHTTNLRRISC